MVEHLGGLSYKDGLVCWSTIHMIFCGDLDGNKLRNIFKLLPNGATLGICAGDSLFLPSMFLLYNSLELYNACYERNARNFKIACHHKS